VEFAEVHVPQAQNIPLDELRPDALALVKDQPFTCFAAVAAGDQALQYWLKAGYAQPTVGG